MGKGKDPAFLWYPGDYLAGTAEYSFEEKGAYVELLMKQFEHGGALSDDRIKRILRESYARIWGVICEKFKQDENGNWFNARLEKERVKRKNFTTSRKKNLEGKRSSHTGSHMGHHTDTHIETHTAPRMENENRNENRNENKNKKQAENFFLEVEQFEDRVKIIEAVFTDEIYVEQLQMAHRGKDIKKAFEECYIHHSNAPNPPKSLGEWRQKLNTWLINTKNGTSKNRTETINSRRADFARKHGTCTSG